MKFKVFGSRTEKTINIKDIHIVIADEKWLDIYAEGRVYISRGTVKEILERYPKEFTEVSRGKIIRTKAISHLQTTETGELFVVPKYYNQYPKIKISRRNHSKIKVKIKGTLSPDPQFDLI